VLDIDESGSVLEVRFPLRPVQPPQPVTRAETQAAVVKEVSRRVVERVRSVGIGETLSTTAPPARPQNPPEFGKPTS
jgi:hypothetical protein